MNEGLGQIFVEVYLSRQQLVICGGGYIGKALCELGNFLKFDTVVFENRKEWANFMKQQKLF